MLVARSINADCAADIELAVPDIDSAAGGVTVKHLKRAILADFRPAFAGVRDDSAVEQGVLRAGLSGPFLDPPARDAVAGCFDFGVLAFPDSSVDGVFVLATKLAHRVSNHVTSKQRSCSGPHGVAGVGDEEPGSFFRRTAAS